MKKINIILLFYVIIFNPIIEASKSNTPPLNNKYADEFQKLSTEVNQRSFSPEKKTPRDNTANLINDLNIELAQIKRNLQIKTEEHRTVHQDLEIALKEREYYRLIASRLAIANFFIFNALFVTRK